VNVPEDEEYGIHKYGHDGIQVHTINNTFRDAGDFFFLYSVLGVNRAAEKILDDFRPDLVHIHHLTCLSTDVVTILRRRGIPTVMTLHDFWMLCPRGQRLHRDGTFCEVIDRNRCHGCIRKTWDFLFTAGDPDALTEKAEMEMLAARDDHVRNCLSGLDRIIVPSRFYRQAFTEYGLDPHRIVVIPHGLDAGPFADREAGRELAEKTRIAFLGTVIPSKGVHILLEAVHGLGDRVSVEIHGEAPPYHNDEEYMDRLEAAVPEGVTVNFHGRYEPDEIHRVLQGADILVVPSLWPEAFGLTVREGFLAGIPVVASDMGALREGVHPDRGLLFKPGDAEDLRRQLIRLLDDAGLKERLCGLPEWVRTPDEMAADTMAVYESAVEKKTDEPPAPPDAVHQAFSTRVESVRAIDRETLLKRVHEKLERLALSLKLDPGPVSLLKALPGHTWKIRDDFQIHATEAGWLREERATRQEELGVLRREITWLEKTQEHLKDEKAYLEESLNRQEEDLHAVKQSLEESVNHAQDLGDKILKRDAQLHEVSTALQERETLLRRLAGSTLVRYAARLKKIREIEAFEP